jgi:ribosomal protein L24E
MGYWVFDANGCAAQKGDAVPFAESICATPLNGPVLDAATNPAGPGYWLVASDGGIFAFGGAPFKGSMGGSRLNGPVVGMAPALDGQGYWEVASDGGIFAFGEPFVGSMGAATLNQPVTGMVASGSGYMMVAADGGVFNFANPFFGSLGNTPPATAIVSIAPSFDNVGTPNGYWMLDAAGNVYAFGGAWAPASRLTFPGNGTFRVGIDISPGTYRTSSRTSNCYWERVSGLGGTVAEILGNDIGNGYRVVTIAPGDVGFFTDGCGQWTSSTAPITTSLTAPIFGDGIYRVGIDIAPGLWNAGATTNCYWARLSGFGGTQAEILASGFGDFSSINLQIFPSEAGFEVSGCAPFFKH